MSRAREKNTVEDHRALDVRSLQRDGILVAGWRGNLRWSRDGEVRASIGLEVESLERVRLRYNVTIQGKTEVKDYPVAITWTPCQFGGNRPWFLCPCCWRRVAKLYSYGMFACRHCQRLNYRCQQAKKRDVASDRSLKLRHALGCDEGFLSVPAQCIPKPKGMHWRTFERKIEQLKAVDARALGDAIAIIGSFERRLGR
ncbi:MULTISPECIES: hypothetical protein [Pseudomonas aeruginosa group]|uniref:hypothetical protein n=1 Tax=Pseudomonas aeruginosa group TaxID=136841 RepID=UPI001F03903D|nr:MULTISPECIES: hypothetical protein [Pseudomonas aeruginosa group]